MFINLFAETISIMATKHCETLTETNIVCFNFFFHIVSRFRLTSKQFKRIKILFCESALVSDSETNQNPKAKFLQQFL
jgi:hypothetical protein